MARSTEKWFEPLGLVWIDCSSPVVSGGLAQILKTEALVYVGQEPPNGALPSVVILCADGIENIAESVKRVQAHLSNAVIVIFGMYPDLALAQTALKSGARGFIHSGMRPEQIVRALKVAFEGEMVAPRELLEYLIMSEQPADLNLLSARQREILELLSDGLTNAQIAKRLFLTESTVKQHLRGTYKILGVSNRTEAAKLLRNSD